MSAKGKARGGGAQACQSSLWDLLDLNLPTVVGTTAQAQTPVQKNTRHRFEDTDCGTAEGKSREE